MHKKYLSLNVLDEYARTLSVKQVKKLYESKTNKKYNKALFEQVAETSLQPFQYWIDEYTITEFGLPEQTELQSIICNFMDESEFANIEYNVEITEDYSLCFYTKSVDAYTYFLDMFDELYGDIIPADIFKSNIDIRYLRAE